MQIWRSFIGSQINHGSVSSSSSFTSSFFSSLSSFRSFSSFRPLSSLPSSLLSFFSSLSSFFLSLFPRFLGQELSFSVLDRSLVSNSLLLFFSWFSGQNDLSYGEESFLFDFEKSFFSWHINVDNLLFSDGDDLVKIWNFSSEDFSNPQCSLDKSLSGFNGHKLLILTKEKGQTSGNVSALITENKYHRWEMTS